MVLKPEILVTPDRPIVKLREPRDKVDLAVELPKILQAQGWPLGTFFNVQFISHDRTKLLGCAEFLVVEESESLQTTESSAYQSMTKAVVTRACVQLTNWWEPSVEPEAEKPDGSDGKAKTKKAA